MPTIDMSPIEVPAPTILQEIRTSQMKQFGTVLSGIDKQLQSGQLLVSKLGLPDDEHDPTFHGGVDKAIHQYCSDHYAFWQDYFPDTSIKARFVPGGFGENIVAGGFNEENVCVGDLVRIGPVETSLTGGDNGCLLEVSLPRQPCFKLNQRFGIKNFAPRTHQQSKTGWYYRVKQEGVIAAGMEIRVVQRDHPRWSIARLQHYVHRDKTDMVIAQELMNMDVIGDECRTAFESRWKKAADKGDARKRGPGRPFRVVGKALETPRIVRLELQAMVESSKVDGIPHPAYAVIKLPNGMKRAYSVVEGNMDRFVLGVARDDQSRGGSAFIHDELDLDATIHVDSIARSMEPSGMASHYIFIVGGIGLTAFLATMGLILAINQTLELHYAVRTSDDIAFRSSLSTLGPSVQIYDKSQGERMNIVEILRGRKWNSQVFTCGPQRMIDAVIKAAADAGMTDDEVHYEVFGADASGDPFTADVVGKDKKDTVEVGSDVSLLEALREAGLEVSSSCETGKCATCRVVVRHGRVDHRGSGLTQSEKETEMLSCVSRGIGHIEIELPEV